MESQLLFFNHFWAMANNFYIEKIPWQNHQPKYYKITFKKNVLVTKQGAAVQTGRLPSITAPVTECHQILDLSCRIHHSDSAPLVFRSWSFPASLKPSPSCPSWTATTGWPRTLITTFVKKWPLRGWWRPSAATVTAQFRKFIQKKKISVRCPTVLLYS